MAKLLTIQGMQSREIFIFLADRFEWDADLTDDTDIYRLKIITNHTIERQIIRVTGEIRDLLLSFNLLNDTLDNILERFGRRRFAKMIHKRFTIITGLNNVWIDWNLAEERNVLFSG